MIKKKKIPLRRQIFYSGLHAGLMVIFPRAHSRTAKRLKCRNIQSVITPIWWLLVINSGDMLKQTIWPLEFKQRILIWKAKVLLSAHENCSHGVKTRFFCCSSRFRNKVISWAGNKYVISAKSCFKFFKYPPTKRSNFLHLIVSLFFCNISSSGNSELPKIKLRLYGLLNETSIIRSPPTQITVRGSGVKQNWDFYESKTQ